MEIGPIKKIKIGGKVFPLAFPLRAMIEMQNTVEGFDLNDVSKTTKDFSTLMRMLWILADNGARLEGGKLEEDLEWFTLHTPVSTRKLLAIQIAVIDTVAEWMMMETEEEDEWDREVDVVLQEIQKKRQTTDSPGEKSQPGD